MGHNFTQLQFIRYSLHNSPVTSLVEPIQSLHLFVQQLEIVYIRILDDAGRRIALW